MSKEVQIAGGSASQQNAYTGRIRELTADTDNFDLRLHDGVTPGGHPILNRNNADERYQQKNPELNGFAGFEPQMRGFWARLGPGEYRLRTLKVNSENLTITNANGYSGDPSIRLADIITTEHTWTGQQLFTEVVQFDAGINSNVSGDLDGDVVGNVTGNLTGNVTGNVTGDLIGAVDVRGESLQLDDGQIDLAKLNGLNARIFSLAIPIGVILIWSGEAVDVPDGWAICDGTNGTPDLRDRFILSAGPVNAAGESGGTSSHTHEVELEEAGAHSHGITVADHTLTLTEIPSHDHRNGACGNTNEVFNRTVVTASPTIPKSIDVRSASGTLEGTTSAVGGGGPHTHTATSDSQGQHTHVTAVSEELHIPPYYSLYFIMRVA